MTADARTDWDEDDEPAIEPYRDGMVHVMNGQCSTCVFRPGNIMNLPPGRLKGMTDHVQETGIPFSCHQTLPYSEREYRDHYDGAALCAGAVENYGEQSAILRMAEAFGNIKKVEPYDPDNDRAQEKKQ